MLRYVTLCYVMLCYVMLCYVMLCNLKLSYVMVCYVILLCYVMICYAMLCYVILCYVMSLSHILFSFCSIFVGTWNVNGQVAGECLKPWFKVDSICYDIIAVGYEICFSSLIDI